MHARPGPRADFRADHGSGPLRATTALTAVLFALLTFATNLLAAPTWAAQAQGATGGSEAGVVPIVLDHGPGGNATCADVPGLSSLTSSARLDVRGDGLSGTLPVGLSATLSTDSSSLSWTSTFRISAVIVKGGSEANVYVYVPALLADARLVAPPRSGDQATEISNVTFCWDPDPQPPGDDPDLLALCASEAEALEVGDIVSFAGPIRILEGEVVESTVDAGFVIDFGVGLEEIGFVAPFEVVVAVTAAPDPTVHRIEPPSTAGSVPLSSNPGAGEIVLCGLDASVVAALSCAQVGADGEVGPVEIRGGSVDPDRLPPVIKRLDLAPSVTFVTVVPVVAVMVEASDPVLYEFERPVLRASIPVEVAADSTIDLTFCVLSRAVRTADPGDTPAMSATGDPVEIATGGGPSAPSPLALLALVGLAMAGPRALLRWSRGG